MVEALTVSYAEIHKKRGRHRELLIEDMLLRQNKKVWYSTRAIS
jgi:hypothetical protein